MCGGLLVELELADGRVGGARGPPPARREHARRRRGAGAPARGRALGAGDDAEHHRRAVRVRLPRPTVLRRRGPGFAASSSGRLEVARPLARRSRGARERGWVAEEVDSDGHQLLKAHLGLEVRRRLVAGEARREVELGQVGHRAGRRHGAARVAALGIEPRELPLAEGVRAATAARLRVGGLVAVVHVHVVGGWWRGWWRGRRGWRGWDRGRRGWRGCRRGWRGWRGRARLICARSERRSTRAHRARRTRLLRKSVGRRTASAKHMGACNGTLFARAGEEWARAHPCSPARASRARGGRPWSSAEFAAGWRRLNVRDGRARW
mmetsp:Transcript_10182/g.32266  ORF Transcript_10182/g.32266 Transcript_10182/m.32266 type:complete len:323 (-) Transcript_10182:44-1012(-)